MRLSAVLDDEDQPPTTGCCFVRSRDAARLTSSSPGVAVCGTAASDAISTARLLGESSRRGACSLTAAAAVNAACEPLLSAPSRLSRPLSDDEEDTTNSTSCVTTRQMRDSGIAFIDEDDRL